VAGLGRAEEVGFARKGKRAAKNTGGGEKSQPSAAIG